MGYNTDYALHVEPPIPEEGDHTQLEEVLRWTMDENWKEGYLGNCSCSWYDHDEELKEVSKLYPDHLFTLWGVGEGEGDLWVTYYKNGKMQYCPARITYADFDEGELE